MKGSTLITHILCDKERKEKFKTAVKTLKDTGSIKNLAINLTLNKLINKFK